MERALKMLIAGGGTGGHLFPGIAIGEAFLRLAPVGSEILFVGTPRGIEARVLPERELPHEFLEVGQLKGLGLMRKLMTLISLPLSLFKAMGIIRRFSPDVVIGVGGYVSGPVVLAARLMGKKTAIQEQNSVPGLTNKILGRVVHTVFTAFEAARAAFPARKVVFSGNPVREEIAKLAEEESALPEKTAIVVLGGSQGAKAINEVMPGVYRNLAGRFEGLSWTHQTGQAGYEETATRYEGAPGEPKVAAFLSDMGRVYAGASLIVGRAGASTLAELSAIGRGSVLIPFPFATDNHQEVNARELEDLGAARVVIQKKMSADGLSALLGELIEQPGKLEDMAARAREHGRPSAAADIAGACIDMVSER